MKKKETFDQFTNERRDEMQILYQQINYNGSTYYFKNKNKHQKINRF